MISNVVLGFLSGVGVDEIMRRISLKFTGLQRPTPIKIPGYDPEGVHMDDLISLGICGSVAVGGLVTKDAGMAVTGLSMIAGSYVYSTIIAEKLK